MRQIVPNVFDFSGLLAGRVYAVIDADGITLVDAGLSLAPAKILRQLATHGYRPEDVKRIIITHAHTDHIGGLPALKRLTGATVAASAREKPIIEGREKPLYPRRDSLSGVARLMARDAELFPPTSVDVVIGEGDLVPALGGLEVLAVPGHTPGHLAFWQPQRRILFCGDVVLNLFGLRLPFAAFTPDMAADIASAAKLAALEPETICFGHGNPLKKNAATALRAFARKVANSTE